ncbi:MAG TPA: hypothetical protein VF086_04510 [Propionibacteriaceae bacterium]
MAIASTLAAARATFSWFYCHPVRAGLWSAPAERAVVIIVLLVLTSCVRQATPSPAEQRSTPPPWSAPRDAISYITAAGLNAQPLSSSENSRVVKLRITVDGAPVEVPAYVGIDRVRTLHAPVHTHDTSGEVWLEGRETDAVTLGQFFTVWGVRFDDQCLGSACGALLVTVDGKVSSAPREVRLAASRTINITATS